MILSEVEGEVVLDASLFLAAISAKEIHHDSARKLYDAMPEDQPFVVPALFRTEVISALSRRREPDELLDAVDALISGPRFHVVALERPLLERATIIAREARLRAYDSVYAALAMERGAALLTLDVDVSVKLTATFPQLALVALQQ